MADRGMIGGFFDGVNSGLDTYMALKKLEDSKTRTKMLGMSKGLIIDEDGEIARDPSYEDPNKVYKELQAKLLETQLGDADAKNRSKRLENLVSLMDKGFDVEWRPQYKTKKGLGFIPDESTPMISGGFGVMPEPSGYDFDESTIKRRETPRDPKDAAEIAFKNAQAEELKAKTKKMEMDLGAEEPGSAGEYVDTLIMKGLIPNAETGANMSKNSARGLLKLPQPGQRQQTQIKPGDEPGSGINAKGYLDKIYGGKSPFTDEQLSKMSLNDVFHAVNANKQLAPQRPGAAAKPSIGDQSADRQFGKEYSSFISAGGFSKMKTSMKELKNAMAEVKSHPEYFSGVTRWIGGKAEEMGNPGLVALRQKVQKIIQQDLRPTLGAQFTEKEGQGLMDRTFNARLNAKQVVKQLEDEFNSLNSIVAERERSMRHWEQNRTMGGYSAARGLISEPPENKENDNKKKAPPVGTKKTYKGKTYIFKGGDHTKKENWE